MDSNDGNSSFQKSNEYYQRLGKRLDIHYSLKIAKSCPKTCIGLTRVADAECRDDLMKKQGFDCYSVSIEALMDAHDTFIREYYKRKYTAGTYPYDLCNPVELTIKIIWTIRNTWSHNGSVIDAKCKKSYNKIMASITDVKPVIDLPQTINIGDQLSLKFDDYKKIKVSVMEFIKNRVDSEDYEILASRSCNTNFRVTDALITMRFLDGTLSFNLVEAYDNGFNVDSNGKVIPPDGTKYNFEKGVIELSHGHSFPATFEKDNN